MNLTPRDRRTLFVRLALIALVLRLVSLFGTAQGPSEAATALGLGMDGPSGEWLAGLIRHWVGVTGGSTALARLPALVFDLLLPLLAVRYAVAAGWGTVPGLVAGLVLALAPLGVESGYRLDLASGWALVALTALWLQRLGMLGSRLAPVLLGVGLLTLAGLVAPPVLLVVPAGIYIAVRGWADRPVRIAALGGWLVAPLLAMAGRWALFGFLVPEPDAAARWLVTPGWTSEPSGWAQVGGLHAAWQALAAMLPGGVPAELARQLGIAPAPLWTLVVSLPLAVLAAVGIWRGRVQADPVEVAPRPLVKPPVSVSADDERDPTQDVSDDDAGAAAGDGWRTLGVGLPTAPRELGDRDWVPPLACVLGAAIYVAQAGARGVPDGLATALAVGRVGAALLFGLGVAAVTFQRPVAAGATTRGRGPWLLAFAALAVVGLGVTHLQRQMSSLDRVAPSKVARYIQEHASSGSAVVALGPRGLPVAFLLDPKGTSPLVRVAPLDAAHAIHALSSVLPQHPPEVVLVGDRAMLVEAPPTPATPEATELAADLQGTGQSLDGSLQLAGYVVTDASALGTTALVRYGPPPATAPDTIRPQLAPGVAP